MHNEHRHAFGMLYASHHRWLFGMLRKKLGCDHKAEDLAQDTFLKVLLSQAAPLMKEPRAFLSTVANGLVVNHWRRLEIERAYMAAVEYQSPQLAVSPEDRAVVLEALCQIDALLSRLPPKASSAFLMARLEGLGYAEIAERLGVSDRMVKKYMAQAMHQLLLADEEAGAAP